MTMNHDMLRSLRLQVWHEGEALHRHLRELPDHGVPRPDLAAAPPVRREERRAVGFDAVVRLPGGVLVCREYSPRRAADTEAAMMNRR